ncbi:MAG: membrane lipoprotein lipid attachment site-containing protein, partial [Oscillospiraceae bacterium]|nr:membrane lipoprotein lipid attachment site-containing protein [Oscillospiraceae bacterium]
MKKILCAIAILAMLSGCKQSTEQITETSIAETTTAEITTAKVTTETSTETSAETVTESTESVTETEYKGFDYEEYFKNMEYFFSYDLDGDGADEDLFINTYWDYDEICAAFYYKNSSEIYTSTSFHRSDSVDLYSAHNYEEHDDNGETRFLISLDNENDIHIGFTGTSNYNGLRG